MIPPVAERLKEPSIWYVKADDMENCWPIVAAAYLDFPGLEDFFSLEELADKLFKNPDFNVWLYMDKGVVEGYMVTQLMKNKRKTALHIVGCAGKDIINKYLPKTMESLEQYASMVGADEVSLEGRPGWEKVMRRYGYQRVLKMTKNVNIRWRN
jgi:hypothetical protein